MARFILRIDDCGWTPEKKPDAGLDYFRAWRAACDWYGLPIHYGFIPSTLTLRELDWLRSNLTESESLALHGYTHERGEIVSAEMMIRGRRVLELARPTRAYIPPFNASTPSTIAAWHHAAGGVSHFFGGFPGDEQSVQLGDRPLFDGVDAGTIGVWHWPAFRPLYAHVPELLEAVPKHLYREEPTVVTMHCTWDINHFGKLATLREMLAPHLISLGEAVEWMCTKNSNSI